MESNTFKSTEMSARAVLLCATLAGAAVMGAAFLVDPFGPPVVLVSWCFLLGGLALAIPPPPVRPFGLGLALAGAIPPLFVFLWIWLIVSVGMLNGSIS